jgi:hypothetical protein
MGSTASAPQPLRLEQPPGLEELDPSLLEHERLRERSFSVHTRHTIQPGNEKPRQGRWDRCVQEGARRVLNFTPSWFSVKYVVRLSSLHHACLILFVDSMGTGILSILLYTLPYQFNGLKTIGTIIFFLNLVLFILFLVMSMYVPPLSPATHTLNFSASLRYTIWPGVFRKMLLHPQQSLFLGTFPMGFATLVNMIAFLTLDPGNGIRTKG